MLSHWNDRPLHDLLAEHGLTDAVEQPFPNDGWSGASLTRLQRWSDGRSFILKRTSWGVDWIARATRDHALREGFVATGQLALPGSVIAPYLGAAADGTSVAMLMPDLSGELITWERPDGAPTITPLDVDRVLAAFADLHAAPVPGADGRADGAADAAWPWCPLRERLTLLSPSSAAQFQADGVAAGARFLEGWAAFDDLASLEARALVAALDADPSGLIDALARLPSALLHGDLKVANIAPLADGRTAFIDWQMVMVAPVAVDLAYLLVANTSAFPMGPADVLERYRAAARPMPEDDWAATVDLTMIIGLLLRGWRKGLDARAGVRLASGIDAADDLAWWGERAAEAAGRRL